MAIENNSLTQNSARRILQITVRGAAVILAFSTMLAILWICFWLPVLAAEQRVADLRLAFFSSPEGPDRDIVIVTLTRETLDKFQYQTPIDRAFLADLVKLIGDRGARAIGIDLLFLKPTEDAKDRKLRQVLRATKIPLAVGYLTKSDGLTDPESKYLDYFIPPEDRGSITLQSDSATGIVRWMNPMQRKSNGNMQVSLAARIASKLGISITANSMPIAWRINGKTDAKSFNFLPAEYLYLLPPSSIEKKVVLIGLDDQFDDRVRTPISVIVGHEGRTAPGVLAQANALATLLENRPPPVWSSKFFVVVTTMATGIGVLISVAIGAWGRRLLVCSVSILLLWLLGFGAWYEASVMMPLVVPTLFLLFASVVAGFYVNNRRSLSKTSSEKQ